MTARERGVDFQIEKIEMRDENGVLLHTWESSAIKSVTLPGMPILVNPDHSDPLIGGDRRHRTQWYKKTHASIERLRPMSPWIADSMRVLLYTGFVENQDKEALQRLKRAYREYLKKGHSKPPGFPVRLAKSPVTGAFVLIWVHPPDIEAYRRVIRIWEDAHGGSSAFLHADFLTQTTMIIRATGTSPEDRYLTRTLGGRTVEHIPVPTGCPFGHPESELALAAGFPLDAAYICPVCNDKPVEGGWYAFEGLDAAADQRTHV